MLKTVEPNVFKEKTEKENRTLIDIRTKMEFENGHINNSLNIDYYSSNFIEKIDALDKNKTYSIYCYSGSRSNHALMIMEQLGFIDVLDLSGGTIAWKMNKYVLSI